MRPDLDAVTSSWMVRRFIPGWSDAEMKFVPAGQTLNGMNPDADENITHVDTGRGRFDHHQFSEKLSASLILYNYIEHHDLAHGTTKKALKRLAQFANVIDNFGEMYFPDPTADVYDLGIAPLIDSLAAQLNDDNKLIEMSCTLLDASLSLLKNKVEGEEELSKGIEFISPAGKSIGLDTVNEEAVKIAQKKGYQLVVKKDPVKGFVRIKVPPDSPYELTRLYEILKSEDPKADWFLHASLHMLLNGSSKNPSMKPSVLSLQQVIDIIKKLHTA